MKEREDAWNAIEKLALQSPHVTKLSSPQNVFKQNMLPHLSPISHDGTENNTTELPSMDEIGDQASVSFKWMETIFKYISCTGTNSRRHHIF